MKRVQYPKYKWTFRPFSGPLLFFEKMLSIFPKKDYYLINALPHSGSSYLYNLLTKLTKALKLDLKNRRYRATEQDLYIPALLDARIRTTLTRHHFKATDQNVDLMRIFKIKPIILVRNIFDLVPSFRDIQEKVLNETESTPWGSTFTGYVNESFLELDKEKQYDYLIDICLPWFFSFYLSWYCVNKAGFEVMWLTYEQLIDDPEGTLREICSYYDLEYTNEEIAYSIEFAKDERKLNNFNVGIKGRGETELSREQKEKIKRFTRHYPSIDFANIGL